MPTLLSSLICMGLLFGDPLPLEQVGRLDRQLIPEASGIVKSRRHPGIFWVHNDSGNAPLLFAIAADGHIVGQFRLSVPNIDWEDIAIDDQGHLYLGDIGNNFGALPVRAIYRIDEPDPGSRADKPIAASAVTFYSLPRENRFDAESLIYDRGRATLVAKYRDGREAELFTVPLDPPSPLAHPAQPRSIGRLPGLIEAATGADLSADGTRLAVCSNTVTRIYRRENRESAPWHEFAVVRYPALPIEGIAWDEGDLSLVAEGGAFYRLSRATWSAGSPDGPSRVKSLPRERPGARGRQARDMP